MGVGHDFHDFSLALNQQGRNDLFRSLNKAQHVACRYIQWIENHIHAHFFDQILVTFVADLRDYVFYAVLFCGERQQKIFLIVAGSCDESVHFVQVFFFKQ